MVSDTEIEAACKAFLAEYGDPSAEWWDYRKEVTAALEAAARVRAENDAFQDAVVTGLGAVKMDADGTTELWGRVDIPQFRADGRKGCQEGNSNGGQ